MTQIIIELSEEENKKIGIVKAIHNLPSKSSTIIFMIQKYDLKLNDNPQTPLQ
jgi:hypothetical protein